MDYGIKSGSAEKQKTACAIVGAHEGGVLSPAATALDAATGGAIRRVIEHGDFDGRAGQVLMLHGLQGIAAERVLLVGCGKAAEFGERQYRKALQDALQRVSDGGATECISYLAELEVANRDLGARLRSAVEVCGDVVYRFDEMKSRRDRPRAALGRFLQNVSSRRDVAEGERAVGHGAAIAAAVAHMKDLANRPANHCTPTWLAEHARAMAADEPKLKVTVLGEAQMAKLGMHTLLAVAQGSEEDAQLISIEYRGARERSAAPVVLIGKGVTFDTGGISLKPPEAMDEMKFDMSGAASVIATLGAVAALGLPINVVGVVPATENMPGGRAVKPGDVVTSMSGQTVEILNTDAEGRLILCDALTWSERYKPAVTIDVATLTGACVVALGRHAHGLFSNDDALAGELLEAGRRSFDRAWHMPLWDEYQQQLDSNFADVANIGGREAGSVTAACFLSRFARGRPWAHLDIAGTAYRTGKEKGSTGRPVPLLLQFLITRSGV